MSSKKQTAVEWLIDHITYSSDYGQRFISFKEATDLNIYFQKALAMEKEQIGNAYVKGQSDCDMFTMESEVEQYYNSTYGQ